MSERRYAKPFSTREKTMPGMKPPPPTLTFFQVYAGGDAAGCAWAFAKPQAATTVRRKRAGDRMVSLSFRSWRCPGRKLFWATKKRIDAIVRHIARGALPQRQQRDGRCDQQPQRDELRRARLAHGSTPPWMGTLPSM